MAGGAAVHLFQRLLAAKHEHPLGLKIVGGGGAPRGLKNQLQLFVLHRFIAELAQRIPLLGQFLKSHSCTLRF